MLSFPTADNKAWVAIFAGDNTILKLEAGVLDAHPRASSCPPLHATHKHRKEKKWEEELNDQRIDSKDETQFRGLAARANYLAADRTDIQYATK